MVTSVPVVDAPLQYAASKGMSKKAVAKGLGRRLVGQAGRGVLKAVGGKLLGPVSVASDIKTIAEAFYEGYKAVEARSGARDSLEQARQGQERVDEARRSRGRSAKDRLRELVDKEREYNEKLGKGLPPSTQRLAESLD